MNCKYCLRPLTKEFIEAKRQAKAQNARNSTAKRIANGNSVGFKKRRPDKYIKLLREQYKSMKEIAAIVGFSKATVARSLKEQGIK